MFVFPVFLFTLIVFNIFVCCCVVDFRALGVFCRQEGLEASGGVFGTCDESPCYFLVLKTRHFRNYVFVDAHQRHFGGEVWHTGTSHILYDYSKFSAATCCNVS